MVNPDIRALDRSIEVERSSTGTEVRGMSGRRMIFDASGLSERVALSIRDELRDVDDIGDEADLDVAPQLGQRALRSTKNLPSGGPTSVERYNA